MRRRTIKQSLDVSIQTCDNGQRVTIDTEKAKAMNKKKIKKNQIISLYYSLCGRENLQLVN